MPLVSWDRKRNLTFDRPGRALGAWLCGDRCYLV